MRVGIFAAAFAGVALGVAGCGGAPKASQPKFPVVSATPAPSQVAASSPLSSAPIVLATQAATRTPPSSSSEPASPSPADSAATSSTAAASVYPATEAGAYAIAEAIVREGAAAALTGNLVDYKAIASSDCLCIEKVADYIAQYRHQGTLSGGQVSAFRHVSFRLTSQDLASTVITFDATPTVVTDGSGRVVGRSKQARQAEDVVNLRKVRGSWRVLSVSPLASGTH